MNVLAATGTGIGQPVPRKEDRRLLTGKGNYTDDVHLPDQSYAIFARSPYAHARILSIDSAVARALPGVLAVLTGANMTADKLNPIKLAPSLWGAPDVSLVNRDGSKQFISPRYLMAIGKVRFVGEAVAMVIAETLQAARDGAEALDIRYEELPVVTTAAAALAEGAPCLWDEHDNLCVDADVGNPEGTAAAFARAAHVTRFETQVNRVTGVPMELRGSTGDYDPATGRYTIYGGGNGVVRAKAEIANALGVEPELIRVLYRDIGGNFGTRGQFQPETALVAWAAKRVARPVKWVSDRTECFLTDFHSRDLTVEAELALDADGKFLAMRSTNTSNLGAVTASWVPLTKGVGIMSSVYAIPVAHYRARAVLSNTAPTSVYRSAGRPEAMWVMERLIDLAALETGIDKVELRRRNLIRPEALPYTNPSGVIYDNGNYEEAMDWCLRLSDWDGYAARKADSRRRGKLRGIGLANYIEITTGVPRERAEITILPEGRAAIVIGTQSSGQGHETSFAQPVSEWLGVPFDNIDLVTGDSDLVPVGGGSNSGRSMRFAGILLGKASNDIIAQGSKIAAHLLEAHVADIEFTPGWFRVRGTDRALSLFAVAGAARDNDNLPEDLRGRLASAHDETFKVAGFPYGSHVCEVEIDPDTGVVTLARYAAVDDVGRAVNPLILHGQTHGGVAQGVGQALWEYCHYDQEGQLISASLMDYTMPRADLLPSFDTAISEVPSPTNPLGIRAGGEGGTTPALAVVINAVVDALSEFGVTHVEMPATPERVWRAMQGK